MSWNGTKALVTGGAGFVASHIVDMLVAAGARVTVVDNLRAGTMANLTQVAADIEFMDIDIRDADSMMRAAKGQDMAFHLAANASVPNSFHDPRYDFETNSLGTLNLLEAARLNGVGKIVYASSAAVYGEPLYVPVDEAHTLNPCSLYGCSKLSAERLGFMYGSMFGLGFTAIRIFNTYGPRQPRYVLADLLRKLRSDPSKLEVLGDGTQIRDYSYVRDTARAFLLAAESDESAGEVYNISGGNPISIRDLVSLLLRSVGLSGTEVCYTGQSWAGDITRLVANIDKIRDLGHVPRFSLEMGLQEMVEWFDRMYSSGSQAG